MQHRKTSVNTAAGVSAASYSHQLPRTVARRNSRIHPLKCGGSETKHNSDELFTLLNWGSCCEPYRLWCRVGRRWVRTSEGDRLRSGLCCLSAVPAGNIGRAVNTPKCFGTEEGSNPLHNARNVSPTGPRSPPSTSFPNHHWLNPLKPSGYYVYR